MKKRFLFPVIGLLCWIIFIFTRSLQPANLSTMESQWVLDLIQAILPFDVSMHFVRKAAHFIEFAVLGCLARLAFGTRFQGWLSSFLFAVITGVVVALCDETIQLFVSGRTGQIQDIWLDTAGAFMGAVIPAVIHRFFLNRPKT